MGSVDVLHGYNAQKTWIIYTVGQTISRTKKSGYAYVCFPRYTPSAPLRAASLSRGESETSRHDAACMRRGREAREEGKEKNIFAITFFFFSSSRVPRDPKLVRRPPMKPVV